ncbi:MAG: hypothetical protein GYA17_18035, partial [Chloroflexi bacterium]|nr:hypothetical protein [Chloroflexota bacterium]
MESTRPTRAHNQRQRRSPVRAILLALLLLICVSLGGLAWALERLPRQAEQVFGPASLQLGTFDRLQ